MRDADPVPGSHCRRLGPAVIAPGRLGLLMATSLAVAPAAVAQQESDEASIRTARAESNRAIARQDVPGILATVEAEIRVSASSGAFLAGREELGDAFAARFAEFEDATYVRSPETIEVSDAGPVAAETGTWIGSWTTPDGPFRTGGRYVAYWRETAGRWLIHAELYVPLFCEGPGCDA